MTNLLLLPLRKLRARNARLKQEDLAAELVLLESNLEWLVPLLVVRETLTTMSMLMEQRGVNTPAERAAFKDINEELNLNRATRPPNDKFIGDEKYLVERLQVVRKKLGIEQSALIPA